MAGESEIKAQIKLRFVTAGGQPMVIVRSFQVEGLHELIPPALAPLLWWLTLLLWLQLIQKKLQLQYKALDQVLQTHNKDTGQKEAISYRCGDMDRIVPNLMGVSKVMTALLLCRSACDNLASRRPEDCCIMQAIMENVIFVHQEESNWPLSEGATLKKKFDDIFSATKYTKVRGSWPCTVAL